MVPPGHFAGASYPVLTIYREISARRSLMPAGDGSPKLFSDTSCPRQGSEGGRSRPLDHMRQIPFVQSHPSSTLLTYTEIINVSSIWYILRFEHAHVLKQCL